MYRKIFPRMWRPGGSFRRLSGPDRPNAQHLWLYLLTGDATVALPGVVPIGRLALAESLGWEDHLDELDACIAELTAAGMIEADLGARLIWCKRAIEYNPPQSPNAVKPWAKAFVELPECELKDRIFEAARTRLDTMTNEFLKAFDEGLAKAFAYTGAGAGAGTGAETGGGRGGTPPGSSPSSTPSIAPDIAHLGGRAASATDIPDDIVFEVQLSTSGEYGYITQTLLDELAGIYTEVDTLEVAQQYADKVAAGGYQAPVDASNMRQGLVKFLSSERKRMRDGGGRQPDPVDDAPRRRINPADTYAGAEKYDDMRGWKR